MVKITTISNLRKVAYLHPEVILELDYSYTAQLEKEAKAEESRAKFTRLNAIGVAAVSQGGRGSAR